MLNVSFANQLTETLKLSTLTANELADFCEVGHSTISRWLSGTAQPMKRTRNAVLKKIEECKRVN
jgi:transcriptional regulator with XRE-family HTH domain